MSRASVLWHLFLIPLLCAASLAQSSAAPRIFFTDLTSGPNTGGEGGAGAFVTLYGNFFGTSPTVKVGGVAATVKLAPTTWLWYQKMAVQIPSNAPQGATSIQVTTANGTSNSAPFTVRAGTIRFVGTQSGDIASIVACKNQMAAGDICYVRNGVNATGTEDYNATVLLNNPATTNTPRALVTYPGATSSIGTTSSDRGVYACSGLSACSNGSNWVVAGFTVNGSEALQAVQVSDVRFVGLTVNCPNGDGSTGCFESSEFNNGKLLGLHVANAGIRGADKTYHSIYFSTNSNHHEVAWSHVHGGGACRGIQFHSTSGDDQFDLHIHDNQIHDTVCNGLNFASVNPGAGTVEAYNNVIYNSGTGPDPGGGQSDYSCIMVASFGATNSGAVQIYNNTLYNCGTRGGGIRDVGMITVSRNIALTNNIIQAPATGSIPYFTDSTSGNVASMVTGSKNVWFGAGNGPSATTGNINANPMLNNPAIFDLTLKTGSPAIDAGTAMAGLQADASGNLRPSGSAFDIGAFELASGTVAQRPAPPTGLTAVVR